VRFNEHFKPTPHVISTLCNVALLTAITNFRPPDNIYDTGGTCMSVLVARCFANKLFFCNIYGVLGLGLCEVALY
jgi:hypothetical protein